MASTVVPESQGDAASGSMVSEMESAFQSAVESGKIPGAVVMAKDLTGEPSL